MAPPLVAVPVPWAVAVPPPPDVAVPPPPLVVVAGVVAVDPEVVVLAVVLVDPDVWVPVDEEAELPLEAGLVTTPLGTVNGGAPDVSVEFVLPPPQADSASGAVSTMQSVRAAARRRVPMNRARTPSGRRLGAAPSAGRTPDSR